MSVNHTAFMKIVGLVILFFCVLLAMRWWSAHQSRRDREEEDAPAQPQRPELFVRCARCNAHVPKSLALAKGADWVCLDSQCAPSKL